MSGFKVREGGAFIAPPPLVSESKKIAGTKKDKCFQGRRIGYEKT